MVLLSELDELGLAAEGVSGWLPALSEGVLPGEEGVFAVGCRGVGCLGCLGCLDCCGVWRCDGLGNEGGGVVVCVCGGGV